MDTMGTGTPPRGNTPPAAAAEVVTHHPNTFQMVCIVLVQLLNAADWAVILPINTDIASFLGQKDVYGAVLIAALYIPFPLSLHVFREIESYKNGYIFWGLTCVGGNLLYAACMIWRPPGVVVLIVMARMVQGLAQCVTFQNKQILAYTTSWDVRNVYNAYLSSGNIIGVVLGVMICASVVHIIGTSADFINSTPDYLVFGALTVMGLAAVAGVVAAIYHPHEIKMVPAKDRMKPGAATMAFQTTEDDSRKIRIISTLFLGFARIMCRASWQTIAIAILRDDFLMTIWQASIAFSSIVMFAVVAQQGFASVQHVMEDEMWVRVTEIFGVGACVMMLNFGAPEHIGAYWFIGGSVVFYMALSINSNVTTINATKYAIDDDVYFDQKAILSYQLITQNMLGKIAGPLYGAWLYYSFGRNVFVVGMLSVTLVAAVCAEITMPPASLRAETVNRNDEAKEADAEEARPLVSNGTKPAVAEATPP